MVSMNSAIHNLDLVSIPPRPGTATRRACLLLAQPSCNQKHPSQAPALSLGPTIIPVRLATASRMCSINLVQAARLNFGRRVNRPAERLGDVLHVDGMSAITAT